MGHEKKREMGHEKREKVDMRKREKWYIVNDFKRENVNLQVYISAQRATRDR